jgi:hypothetical protein
MQIAEHLQTLTGASLEDAKSMAFLNRFDTKFVMPLDQAVVFLESVQNDYSILEVNGSRSQGYRTLYFDTPSLDLYLRHHNRRAVRHKLRTREYQSNGKIFNEIKCKNNHGKTNKLRARCEEFPHQFGESFGDFCKANGLPSQGISPSLLIQFQRLTLLNQHFPERLTIDYGLSFAREGTGVALPETAIVELKRERGEGRTVAQKYFRSIHVEPSGFSKYCIGCALAYPGLKRNRFLPVLKKLKTQETHP